MIQIITANGTTIEIDDNTPQDALLKIFDEMSPIERAVIEARLQSIINHIGTPSRFRRVSGGRSYSSYGEN